MSCSGSLEHFSYCGRQLTGEDVVLSDERGHLAVIAGNPCGDSLGHGENSVPLISNVRGGCLFCPRVHSSWLLPFHHLSLAVDNSVLLRTNLVDSDFKIHQGLSLGHQSHLLITEEEELSTTQDIRDRGIARLQPAVVAEGNVVCQIPHSLGLCDCVDVEYTGLCRLVPSLLYRDSHWFWAVDPDGVFFSPFHSWELWFHGLVVVRYV